MFKEWKSIVSRPLKIIDIFVSAVVIGITLFLIFFWKNIPEQVPQHWNAAGEIDDYADAGGYIMLVIMMYFFYAWHNLSKLSPILGWKENVFGKELAHKVTKEVEHKVINTFMAMLWVCDLLMELVLAYIIICGVFVRNLGVWFLPLTFLLLTIDFIWFGIQMMRIKSGIK